MSSSVTVRQLTPDPGVADDLFLTRSAFIKLFNNRYSKPKYQDEVDASINREIGNITTERATFLDHLFALGSIGTFIADISTDVLVAKQHYSENNFIWFGLTVTFIVIPSLLMQFFSCKWFNDDYLNQTWWTYTLHCFQLGTIQRYWMAFWYGLKTKYQTVVNESDYIRFITEWRDITLLRLFEGFLEAAPQTVLQLYILSSQKEFIVDRDWLTATSAIVSIISLSWAIVSYSHMLRLCVSDKGLSVCGYMFQILYRLFMVSSRVAVLVLFASVYKEFVFIFVFVHCAVMFAWLNLEDTVNKAISGEGSDPCMNKIFTFIVSIIYLYCFLTVQKNTTRRAISIYYGIVFAESAVLMALWFPYRTVHGALMYSSFGIVFGGFVFGILCMMLYYKFFHPNQDITEGWLFCKCCQSKTVTEEGSREFVLDNAVYKYSTEDADLVIIDIDKQKHASKKTKDYSKDTLSVGIELQRPKSPSKLPASENQLMHRSPSENEITNASKKQRIPCLTSSNSSNGFCGYGACGCPSNATATGEKYDSETKLFSRNSNVKRDNHKMDVREAPNNNLQVRMSKLKEQNQWDNYEDTMINKTGLSNLKLGETRFESDIPRKNSDKNKDPKNNKKNFRIMRQGSKDDSYIQQENSVQQLQKSKRRSNSLQEKDSIRQNLLAWVKEKMHDKEPEDNILTNQNTVEIPRDDALSTMV